MPKIEVFLSNKTISTIEHLAEENQISRSNWVRDAVLARLEKEGYDINQYIKAEIESWGGKLISIDGVKVE